MLMLKQSSAEAKINADEAIKAAEKAETELATLTAKIKDTLKSKSAVAKKMRMP